MISLAHNGTSAMIAERRFTMFNERGFYAPDFQQQPMTSSQETWNQLHSKHSDTSLSPSWQMEPSWPPVATGHYLPQEIDNTSGAMQLTSKTLNPSLGFPQREMSSSVSSPSFSSHALHDRDMNQPSVNAATLGDSSSLSEGESSMVENIKKSCNRLSTSSPSPVKLEPDESSDCFIMEFSNPGSPAPSHIAAPPTEVPLRATQASKEMRKMMGVFRLNPFTIHSAGGRGVSSSWYGEDIGPLEDEPLMLEFKVELDHPLVSSDELQRFSPEFEISEDSIDRGDSDDDNRLSSWERSPPASHLVSTSQSSSYMIASTNTAHDTSRTISRSSVNSDVQRLPVTGSPWSASPLRVNNFLDTSDSPHSFGNNCPPSHFQMLPGEVPRRWSLPNTTHQAPFLI